MNQTKRMSLNASYLGVAEVVSKSIQFLVMVGAARSLSQEQFGVFSTGLSFAFIAMIVADIGINMLLVREIAIKPKQAGAFIINAASVKAFLGSITFLFTFLAAVLLDYSPEARKVLFVMAGFAILTMYTEMFYSLFRAFERMQYDAILKTLRMMLLAGAAFYSLSSGKGVVHFAVMFLATEAIVLSIALGIGKVFFIKRFPLPSKDWMLKLVKKAYPFGLAFIFGSIYFHIDVLMLSAMRSAEEVALYSAASNLALALLFIPIVYTNVIYPVLSRYHSDSDERLSLLYQRSFKYLYMVSLPIGAGMLILSPKIIGLLYGMDYSPSAVVLAILSGFVLIKFVNFVLGIVLSSIDRQKERMRAQGFTALFNVGLNLALIPLFGIIGAASATVITEIFLFLWYFGGVSKHLVTYNFLKVLPRPAMATALMSFGVILVAPHTHVVISVLFGFVIYCAGIILTHTFDGRDWKTIREVLSR